MKNKDFTTGAEQRRYGKNKEVKYLPPEKVLEPLTKKQEVGETYERGIAKGRIMDNKKIPKCGVEKLLTGCDYKFKENCPKSCVCKQLTQANARIDSLNKFVKKLAFDKVEFERLKKNELEKVDYSLGLMQDLTTQLQKEKDYSKTLSEECDNWAQKLNEVNEQLQQKDDIIIKIKQECDEWVQKFNDFQEVTGALIIQEKQQLDDANNEILDLQENGTNIIIENEKLKTQLNVVLEGLGKIADPKCYCNKRIIAQSTIDKIGVIKCL